MRIQYCYGSFTFFDSAELLLLLGRVQEVLKLWMDIHPTTFQADPAVCCCFVCVSLCIIRSLPDGSCVETQFCGRMREFIRTDLAKSGVNDDGVMSLKFLLDAVVR